MQRTRRIVYVSAGQNPWDFCWRVSQLNGRRRVLFVLRILIFLMQCLSVFCLAFSEGRVFG